MQTLRWLAGLLAASATVALPGPAAAAPVTLAQVGTFTQPVFVTAPPGDTRRIVVVEQAGTVRMLVDGAAQATPFLDLRSSVASGGERGLLSLAFAPDYATSGRFYVYYTSRSPLGTIQIDEFRHSTGNPDVADPATRRPLLSIAHPVFANHNGGQLAFGPDGMLWAGTGDGGAAGDPPGNAQNPSSLLGKLLRIDPRPGAASLIPGDNPFAGGGGAREAWALGLRNPWRFSFDRSTGDLVIGDVGQDFAEEIDFVPRAGGLGRAANYGWDRVEGTYRYDDLNRGDLRPAGPADFPPGHLGPVIQRFHADGWASITGGYVVRDPALPELAGKYVYGDFGKGEVWAATLAGGAQDDASTGLRVSQLSSFGEDACGRVYVASLAGPVYRLATSGACAGASTPLPGPDQRAPSVVLRAAARQHVLRKGFLSVVVRCDEQCTVRTHGPIRIARRGSQMGSGLALRQTAFRFVARQDLTPFAAAPRVPVVRRTLAAGAAVRLRLGLPRSVRAVLRRALRRPRRIVEALVTVDAADPAGNHSVRRVRVRIVR